MSHNSTSTHQRVQERQERLADLIMDDESLIGDFPEAASESLVDWAMSVTDRLAASTTSLEDGAAERVLDDAVGSFKTLLRTLSDALTDHEDGRHGERDRALAGLSALAADSRLRDVLVGHGRKDLAAVDTRLRPSTLLRGDPDVAELTNRLIRALDPSKGGKS